MDRKQSRSGAFIIGFYAWLATLFLGAVIIDIVYFRVVPLEPAAFSGAADLLLLIGFVTFLAGLIVIAVSWKSKAARSILIASLLAFSIEFIVPALLSQLAASGQINNVSPWLRITPVGLASILAFFGLDQYLLM